MESLIFLQSNLKFSFAAILSTLDPDQKMYSFTDQNFTYNITNLKENMPFKISGNILETTRMLDYENQTSWILMIRSTDNGVPAMSVEKTFVINVIGKSIILKK